MTPWQRIQDLPGGWASLRSPTLSSLSAIWRDQHNRLKNTEAYAEFVHVLQREWAIETGVIEGLYAVDRGVTQILIEHGIVESLIPIGATNIPRERLVSLIEDQRSVVEGLFDFVKQGRPITTSYIKEIHAALTRSQDTVKVIDSLGRQAEVRLLSGDWKKLPNNPLRPDGVVHRNCPPEHVASEVERLVEMHEAHEAVGVAPEVEAAFLHHRFTQIHPFQDGNGRVARAVASLVFLRAGWFPVSIDRDQRAPYIEALENADDGNMRPLVMLFAALQEAAFRRAISLSTDAIHASFEKQVIDAAADRMRKRAERQRKALAAVFITADQLKGAASVRLDQTASKLVQELGPLSEGFRAWAQASGTVNDFWFRAAALDIARRRQYYADVRSYRGWVRLKIVEDRQTDIVISFHAVGYDFAGVMAASAFMVTKETVGEIQVHTRHVLQNDGNPIKFALLDRDSIVDSNSRHCSIVCFSDSLEGA